MVEATTKPLWTASGEVGHEVGEQERLADLRIADEQARFAAHDQPIGIEDVGLAIRRLFRPDELAEGPAERRIRTALRCSSAHGGAQLCAGHRVLQRSV